MENVIITFIIVSAVFFLIVLFVFKDMETTKADQFINLCALFPKTLKALPVNGISRIVAALITRYGSKSNDSDPKV